MTAPPSNSQATSVVVVVVAIAGGLAAAFHMGKIPAALLTLKADFELSLLQSGLVVSSFSLLAAIGGIALGTLARRIGERGAGTAGLLATGAGALLGSTATGFPFLLTSRLLEGLGFLLVAVTMPGLINRICPPAIRAVALGVWGAFIPAAMSLMLLISPLAMAGYGWRGLWQMTAAAAILSGIVFMAITARIECLPLPVETRPQRRSHRGPILVSLVFTGYSALFAAVTAFLPTYWSEIRSLALAHASYLTSLVVIGNILGNISAGYLVSRGTALTRLMRIALLGGGSCAALLFSGLLPLGGEFVVAWLFTFLAGLLPGAVFAHIGLIAPDPRSIPLTTGMIFQGAGIGQVIGPLGIAAAAGTSLGWLGGAMFLGAIMLGGLALTASLPQRFNAPVRRE